MRGKVAGTELPGPHSGRRPDTTGSPQHLQARRGPALASDKPTHRPCTSEPLPGHFLIPGGEERTTSYKTLSMMYP